MPSYINLKISLTALFPAVFFLCGTSVAIDISNDPMETRVQSAPPNIMYILDDSGSMDWQFVVSGTNNSRFLQGGTHYEYLYDDPGDNAYTDDDSNGTILSGDGRRYWKALWHGHNLIYFNPAEDYKAWPGKNNIALADLRVVRSNPENASPTVDITEEYVGVGPFAVVVDNGEPGFSLSNPGDWGTATDGTDYGTNYYYTTSSNTTTDSYAEWQTVIPATGQYNINAWWRSTTQRSTNVAYQIWKNGALIATESPFNQQTDAGQWNPIGNYTFSTGDTVSVRMYTSDPGTSKYCADAMQFQMDAAPISISHIHYYVWDDADNNEIVDPGEIYLVNFPWNDGNSNGSVDNGEIVRNTYRFIDSNSNDRVDDGELYGPLTDSDIPESIRAKRLEEDGSTLYLTATDEALNFANWFGYYRKRAMTAKYAVSASLSDFRYVNVGLYTLNNAGNRLGTQPILAEQKSLVIDNQDNGFSRTAYWYESGSDNDGEYRGSALYTSSNDRWARWTPNIPEDGDYNVYAWWVWASGRDENACYRVQHDSGLTDCIRVNQREDTSAFNLLGTYSFSAGTGGYVEVRRDGDSTGTSTSADAVMFEPVDGAVTVDQTDVVRDTLYQVGASGGTPLRRALNSVGNYYSTAATGFEPSPYYSEADGGSCQQAFSILMTDGYWNGSEVYTSADDGMPAPYGDSYSNTLADVAMKFYDTDLATELPNQLPTNNYDKNIRQHMVTFSVGFGVEGTISRTDIDDDGTPDPEGACYADDPYFLNINTPRPVWPEPSPDALTTTDDLWHASVNGRGQFFNASSPEDLVTSLKAITKDINSRLASGSSVAVNGEELSTGVVLYQATYNPGDWTGNVSAYPINKTTGEILRADGQELWKAADKLQEKSWDARRIFTSNGESDGLNFHYDDLESYQQTIFGSLDAVNHLRGEEIAGMRVRPQKLGDIVHSSPLLTGEVTPKADDGIDNDGDGLVDEDGESVGGTIFAGGNDGMLHAFDAQTGEERFAFIPSLVHGHLTELTENDYDHRFYVDATPTAKTLIFWDDPDDPAVGKTTQTMLVGGLGRGGKGYYALDITDADSVDGSAASPNPQNMFKWEYPRRYFNGEDDDGDGVIDNPAEASSLLEYMYRSADTDGRDNNFDGEVDETDEMALYVRYDDNDDGTLNDDDQWNLAYRDDDLGYTFSQPVVVRTYRSMNRSSQTDHPWAVIFGNGYDSENGYAVLYILDVLTGEVIKKIDTGVGGGNGLSSPVVIDVNQDDRADYVYAGDLKGNMWKFDLTSNDPDDWRIAHEDALGEPQPMFSAPGQAITVKPDVMFHPKKHGYMVFFGTGQFLGETDRTDNVNQTIFGIWDFGDDSDRREYVGTWDRTTNSLSNHSGVKLQQQVVVDERYNAYNGAYLRTLSDHKPHWYLEDDATTGEKQNPAGKPTYLSDTDDNDNDDRIDETSECDYWDSNTSTCTGHTDLGSDESTGHVGWFFDLPGIGAMDGRDNDGDGDIDEPGEQSSLASERVVKDLIIRDGKLIALSFIPDASPCSGGGTSILHEFDATSGSRIKQPVFDISGDRLIDQADLITIPGIPEPVSPTGISMQGLVSPPAFVDDPDRDRELKIFSTSAGTTEVIFETPEQLGLYLWRELNN